MKKKMSGLTVTMPCAVFPGKQNTHYCPGETSKQICIIHIFIFLHSWVLVFVFVILNISI